MTVSVNMLLQLHQNYLSTKTPQLFLFLLTVRNYNYLEKSLNTNKAFQINQSRTVTGPGKPREEGEVSTILH